MISILHLEIFFEIFKNSNNFSKIKNFSKIRNFQKSIKICPKDQLAWLLIAHGHFYQKISTFFWNFDLIFRNFLEKNFNFTKIKILGPESPHEPSSKKHDKGAAFKSLVKNVVSGKYRNWYFFKLHDDVIVCMSHCYTYCVNHAAWLISFFDWHRLTSSFFIVKGSCRR